MGNICFKEKEKTPHQTETPTELENSQNNSHLNYTNQTSFQKSLISRSKLILKN